MLFLQKVALETSFQRRTDLCGRSWCPQPFLVTCCCTSQGLDILLRRSLFEWPWVPCTSFGILPLPMSLLKNVSLPLSFSP